MVLINLFLLLTHTIVKVFFFMTSTLKDSGLTVSCAPLRSEDISYSSEVVVISVTLEEEQICKLPVLK